MLNLRTRVEKLEREYVPQSNGPDRIFTVYGGTGAAEDVEGYVADKGFDLTDRDFVIHFCALRGRDEPAPPVNVGAMKLTAVINCRARSA